MKKFKLTILITFIIILYILSVAAQIKPGNWRDHLSFHTINMICESKDNIFCATDGGIIIINKNNNTYNKFTKVNGLSDVSVRKIAFSNKNNCLLIIYDNLNIDIIENNKIINLPHLKNKIISGKKEIYNIFIDNYMAYLSTSFGIIVLDLNKKEFKDNYILYSQDFKELEILDIFIHNDTIYTATSNGIYKSNLNNNLSDFNSWVLLNNLPFNSGKYTNIVFFNNSIFTIYQKNINSYVLYKITNNFNLEVLSNIDNIKSFFIYNNKLYIFTGLKIYILDNQGNLIDLIDNFWANYLFFDELGNTWIGSYSEGAIKVDIYGSTTKYLPAGPRFNDVGEMSFYNNYLWVSGGNMNTKWSNRGFYLFKDEKWESFNNVNLPTLENIPNVNKVCIDKNNPGHVYYGSIGYGLVEFFFDNKELKYYDETNSILKTINNYGHGYITIKGIIKDKNNNVWIASEMQNNPIYVIRSDNTWENIKFNFSGFSINTYISGLYNLTNNQNWLLLTNDGIFVFQEISTGNIKEKFFYVVDEEGYRYNKIYCLAEDKNGYIWIGTDQGPLVYYNINNIFEQDKIVGYQIKIPRERGSNIADVLLKNEKINCIVVDDANRKWIGTEKSGVFLLSEDGKKEIYHFTFDNSPLLSNNVYTIAINNFNGEVFFGTDKGIVSFRDYAIKGSENFKNVYVYPNPVRENFTENIVITGLMDNTTVKITDVSGNLVWETKSLGGQAIWNGKSFNGKKVNTGVYLIFCSNLDGTETFVTKLLIIK